MEKQLHFIVGIGRSGTTILSKLLNKFTDVHCMPEANFLVFFLYKFRHKTHFTSSEIKLIFDEIELYCLTHPLVGWDFEIQKVKQSVINIAEASQKLTYIEICKIIYKNFKVLGSKKENAHVLMDKNPSYSIFIDKISAFIPNAKFIWIVRDHRANILSRKESIYLKSPNIAYNATRWKLYNRDILRFKKKYPEKVLLVKYEDLVLNYDKESLKINQFLNISQNIENTEYQKKQSIKIDNYHIQEKYKERFLKKYSDLNKELNGDRLHVWKEKLSQEEIELCDVICSKIAKSVGYKINMPLSLVKSITLIIKYTFPIIRGYVDIYKDKIIYYSPIKIKLERLQKRYTEMGFIKRAN
ncbi:sulfotransferase [Dolichospermum sp. ST_con]|nr:sulfotransferase [Dolichospermum sp. ST_con]